MALPDPEMRKFLKDGTPDGICSALSPHVSLGLQITGLDEDRFTLLSSSGTEYTAMTSQPLKDTVRMANTMVATE